MPQEKHLLFLCFDLFCRFFFYFSSVTFFIVVINLCLYIGLLQFCGVFLFLFSLSFFKFNFLNLLLFCLYLFLCLLFLLFFSPCSYSFSSVRFSCSVVSDFCDPMNRSMPGLPVHHQLPESTQTDVHCVMMPSNHLILCCPFSSCPQSFPASGSFPMSQLFASGGQSIGVSASISVLPVNTQDCDLL